MISIQNLRKLAELNLCEECYKTYLHLLEPTVKDWLYKPLREWAEVESRITQMVMKRKGVFKSDLGFIPIEVDEEFAEKMDLKEFTKIKFCGFRHKIDFLKEDKVLQNSSHEYLCKVSEIRNKIHDVFYEFLDQDFALFYVANHITSLIYSATMQNLGEEISNNLKANAEKIAESFLLDIEKKKT